METFSTWKFVLAFIDTDKNWSKVQGQTAGDEKPNNFFLCISERLTESNYFNWLNKQPEKKTHKSLIDKNAVKT